MCGTNLNFDLEILGTQKWADFTVLWKWPTYLEFPSTYKRCEWLKNVLHFWELKIHLIILCLEYNTYISVDLLLFIVKKALHTHDMSAQSRLSIMR